LLARESARFDVRSASGFCSRAQSRASTSKLGFLAGFTLSFTLALSACADATTELHVPTPDAVSFEQNVYPVLLRDCGFPDCHGNPSRFFHVYGPGRTRIKPKTELPPYAPATSEELTATYGRARSMLAYEGDDFDSSLLLNKPLHAAHEGRDEWGNNVYPNESAPGYQAILTWARSTLPAPATPPTGTNDAGAK
jgi:hypothetical protein